MFQNNPRKKIPQETMDAFMNNRKFQRQENADAAAAAAATDNEKTGHDDNA